VQKRPETPHKLRAYGFLWLGERRVLRHANSLAPLTRHRPDHGDKLSRLAPPSELIDRHFPCGIKSLAKCGRSAPVLQRRLTFTLSKSSMSH